MSRVSSDEFVVLPSSLENSNVKLDIRRSGSRDLVRLDESGRQHRPAEPRHDALRCVEVVNELVAPGPGHEGEFSMVSVPTVTGGSPGTLVNGPGNVVGYGARVGLGHGPSEAAMLDVPSALGTACGYGQSGGDELASTGDPFPVECRLLQ